jgi:hypothetical protein
MFVECRHILPRGTKCKAPALRGNLYCYFHDKLGHYEQDGRRYEREPLFLPSLEDTRGIQMAVAQTLAAFGSGRIDARQTGLYLYGLQLATQLAAAAPEVPPQEMVRSTTCDGAGQIIGPEETSCDPCEDCPSCPNRERCRHFPHEKDPLAIRYEQMCERSRINIEVKAIIDREHNSEITWDESQTLLHELSLKSAPSTPLLNPPTDTWQG